MLETLAASLINNLLGEYISNLETKQLSVGIWNGDVVLTNLRLKKDALSSLHLPIDVLEGYLGELTLKIPWADLKKSPLKILVQNLYILAVPKSVAEYDPIEEEDVALEAKKKKLEELEELKKDEESSSFFAQLMTKVLDNVQVTIKNIHIRYEDSVTVISKPLAMGLILSELSANSTDENGNEGYVQDTPKFIFKKLALKNLGAYCDTGPTFYRTKSHDELIKMFKDSMPVDNVPSAIQYLVGPVSGTGRLVSAKKYEKDAAKMKLDLLFDDLAFSLDDYQYSTFISLAATFARYTKSLPYRHLRPPYTITPKLDPKAWFQYAIKSVLKDISDRNKVWTWAHFKERRDLRLAYMDLYSKVSKGTLNVKDKPKVEDLERVLSFDDIRLYRHLVTLQIKKAKAAKEAAKEVAKESKDPKDKDVSTPVTATWSSWFRGSSPESGTAPTPRLTDVDLKQLYDTIEFDPHLAELEADLPPSAILTEIDFRLKSGTFKLLKHKNGVHPSRFVDLVFKMLHGTFLQHPRAYGSTWTIGNLLVDDYSKGTPTNIIRAKPTAILGGDSSYPFFSAVYEHLPSDNRADDALRLSILPLEINVNVPVVKSVIAFFSPPSDEQDGFLSIQNAASGALRQVSSQTQAGLSHAISEHKIFDVRVEIDAPVFIIPMESGMGSMELGNSETLVIDAGHFEVKSKLVDPEKKKMVQDPTRSVPMNAQELQTFLYDHLDISLTGMKVLVGPSHKLGLGSTESLAENDFYLIEHVDLRVSVAMSILPNAYEYTKYRVSGELPRLHLNFSDYKYKTALAILQKSYRDFFGDARPSKAASVPVLAQPKQKTDLLQVGSLSEISWPSDQFVEFKDASETSPLGSRYLSTQGIAESEQVQIDFSFMIGEVSVSLARQSVESLQDVSLLKFSSLNVKFCQRNADYQGLLSLRSASMLDLRKGADPQFLNLLETQGLEKDLVGLEFFATEPRSSRYQGLDYAASLSISSMKFHVVLESALDTYDLIFKTCFASTDEPAPMVTQVNVPVIVTPESTAAPIKALVKVSFNTVTVCLVENATSLGTATVENFAMQLSMQDKDTIMTGSLGRISVKNDSSLIFQEPEMLLHVQDHQTATFSFTTLNRGEFDSNFTLDTSSWKITYSRPFIDRLYAFVDKFMQMHIFLDSAKKAAVESASRMQEGAGRMQLDVHMRSPILQIPQGLWPCNYLVLHLGEIALDNYKDHSKECGDDLFLPVLDRTCIKLHEMKAISVFKRDGMDDQETVVIDSVDLTILNDTVKLGQSLLPKSVIRVGLSPVEINLDYMQYQFIMSVWSMLTSGPVEPAKDMPQSTVAIKSPVNEYVIQVPAIVIKTLSCTSFDDIEPLAQFTGHGGSLKFIGYNNGSFEIEVRFAAFSIYDSRKVQSCFRDMMAPSKEMDDQFVLRYIGGLAGTTINVTIDRPKLIFDLKHLLSIRRFWLGDPAPPSSNQASVMAPPETSFVVRVSFIESEIVLIRDCTRPDSEGVVMRVESFTILIESTFVISCQGLGMFFCDMNRTDESLKLRFLDNVNLTASIDSRPARLDEVGLYQISITTSLLLIRMSYRDILLCSKILDNIMSIFSTPPPLKEIEAVESADVLADASIETLPENATLIKEELIVKMDGMRFVLIDDVDDLYLPMFDLVIGNTSLEVGNWSSTMELSTSLSVFLNYFNIKNSHWEPFLEQWKVSIGCKKVQEAYLWDVFSKVKLDMNVSQVLLETIFRASSALSQDHQKSVARRDGRAPYVIRNQTGYRLHIWAETVKGTPKVETIEPNGELAWSFDDWKTMRSRTSVLPTKLAVQLEGPPWEAVKNVSVDREGVTTYLLRPPINRIVHKMDCSVTLEQKVKVVTFRSTYVLTNQTNIPIEVKVVSRETRGVVCTATMGANQDFSVPIEYAFTDNVFLRPHGFGYNWNTEALHWQDLERVEEDSIVITCHSFDKESPSFRFKLQNINNDKDKGKYPHLHTTIVAPLTLENLLPFSFRYVVLDRQSRQEARGELISGGIDPLHTIEPGHTLALSIRVIGLELKQTEVALISGSEDYQDHNIHLVDAAGRQLDLRIQYGGPHKRDISIYSPYIIYNKTGMEMSYSSRTFMVTAQNMAQKEETVDKTSLVPVLFSFTGFESIRNRAQVKVLNSEWSKPLSFEAVGTSTSITIPTSNKTDVLLGMHTEEGPDKYYLSKVITFQPRFMLKNSLSLDLHCRAVGNASSFVVKRDDPYPLMMLPSDVEDEQCLQVRLGDLMGEWSNSFSIMQIGSIYVKLGRLGSTEEELIRVDINVEKATIFVAFSRPGGKWPIRIDNQTDVDIQCWQQSSARRYKVPMKKSLDYAWDYPSLGQKALIVSANGRDRLIDPSHFGSLVPFKFYGPHGETRAMSIDVLAEGPRVVIKLSPYVSKAKRRQSEDEFVMMETASAIDKQVETPEATSLMEVQIRLEGIGISFISKDVQEFAYATIKSVNVVLKDTTEDQALSFSLSWLQVDNQINGSSFPIFIYPTILPKEGVNTDDLHPVLLGSMCRSKDTSYGVDYYKWFTVLIQEISIELDEDYLRVLLDFMRFQTSTSPPPFVLSSWATPEIKFPRAYEDGDRLYFERILLHPVKVNLSFSRSSTQTEHAGQRSSGVVRLVYDVLTMTIGNIHEASIKLNALELQNPSVPFEQLIDLVYRFYSQEAIGQIHKIIGAADFLGNPVGLFNTVASGVSDLFYEPIAGFEITKPQEFGLGVARGASSLVKKTVFGVTDTLAKMTGSIGKGLSVMTMDDKFQEKRRMASRNRPKHVVFGVTNGAASFVRSVTSGVTGVVSQPLRGAQESGVAGFFAGLGKGLVGVITKPVIGVFDLATNVSEGIKNTTTVFEAELERQRLPRYVAKDKILKAYSKREALGLSFLLSVENARYFHEHYVCHLEMRIEDLVCIVTETRVIMARMRRLRVDWDIAYPDVQLIRAEYSGAVAIVPKQIRNSSSSVLLIPVPDAASGEWLRNQIEETFSAYLTSHNPE